MNTIRPKIFFAALLMLACGPADDVEPNTDNDDLNDTEPVSENDSEENNETTSGNEMDSNADTTGSSDLDTDQATDSDTDQATDSDTDVVHEDECDSTSQCQTLYGAQATDCVDAQSDQSWCECGNEPCNENNTADTESETDEISGTDSNNGKSGVYIEVESVDPTSHWTEETSIGGFYGESYFNWGDPASNTHGITGAPSSDGDALHYSFTIDTPGTYLAEVRGRRDHEGWCTDAANDACNDVWSRMDEGKWTKKMIKQGTWEKWIWDGKYEPGSSVITAEYDLSAGRHTYSLAGRSNGVKIDAIRIYLKGTTPPGPE